ncbi:hypothetical protein Tfer_2752 [Thermincola ferriacetica]|uniref:Uncharacterized protein n=1 Tax=Thermincola ferriacetica TaxID=281456 RepID=A0A0L6VZM6_9FIRM|nr:hypothetical protein [Thermincola ferriacetica]KNZ68661.1 hypothetical protein Tfer_2752 [Thermincola ferriacetica]
MVVYIPDELLIKANDNEEIGQVLKLMFVLFECGKHKWYLKKNDVRLFHKSPCLQSYREFIEKYVVEHVAYEKNDEHYLVRLSIESYIKEKMDILTQNPDIEVKKYLDGKRAIAKYDGNIHDFVDIELAESFLGQPLKIVVENVESDALFITTCLSKIAKIDPSDLWIEFVHGGGSDIPKVLKNFAGKVRVVCIIDCDKNSPEEISADKKVFCKQLQKICDNFGYILHILNKREMENYIPDSALKKYLNATNRCCDDYDYFGLDDIQKDYFDMKKGLHKKCMNLPIWKSIHSSEKEIAATTTVQSLNLFGFGDNVWKAFEYVESESELKSRDLINELDEIVSKIFQLL